jgi:hypothetical protein
MKALTLKDPYAGLIASGKKTIETRTWKVPSNILRQEILITASKNPKTKNSGLALCTVKVSACLKMEKHHEIDACCPVYPGAYAWLLYDLKRIKPFPVKGMLKFFNFFPEGQGIKIEYIQPKKPMCLGLSTCGGGCESCPANSEVWKSLSIQDKYKEGSY